MKQAIMDYILRSPDERRRLHILMLPHQVVSAAERQVQNGGYSIGIFQGTHHRKVAAENEIKFRLITNNIVVSSLQNWW
jgi:dynein heavy chain